MKHLIEKVTVYQAGSTIRGVPMLSEQETIECGEFVQGACTGCGRDVPEDIFDGCKAVVDYEMEPLMRVQALKYDEPIGFNTLEEAKEAYEKAQKKA